MRILVIIAASVFSLLSGSFSFLKVESGYAFAEQEEFNQLRSEHFIISYREGVDRVYVRKIKSIAEKYYRVITQAFDFHRDEFWIWENRAKVFIAKDREDYSNSFNCSPWSTACVYHRAKIIYTYPDQNNFTPIFIHELTHIIFREHIGNGDFPLWLDEGVASYMGDRYGGGDYKKGLNFLKRKIKDDSYIKFFQLNKLTNNSLGGQDEDFINLFYLESFSIINFIMKKYGKYRFSSFLRLLKNGKGVEEAITKIFYDCKNFNELEVKWKAYYLK